MHDLTTAYLLLLLGGATSMLIGGLLLTGGLTAPVAVRVLDEASAARFLRAFWPRYYAIGAIGGLLMMGASVALALMGPFGVVYGSALVMISALFITGLWLPLRLTPVLNAARDAGDAARFARLHQLVLALTGASLLFGAAWLVALGWVLPAQYGMQHV